MRKFLPVLLFITVLFLGMMKVAHAASLVNLDIKNNGVIIYSGTITLSSTPSEDNVLSVIEQADTLSSEFNISNIIHYSFGDYLKCITISGNTELCDNWEYKVNGDSPEMGMSSYTLSGGENVLLYFGDDVPTTENAGGPLTTIYMPPPSLNPPTPTPTIASPVSLQTILPTSSIPETKPVILPPPETKKIALIPKIKIKEKNLTFSRTVLEKQNTASVINATTPTSTTITTPTSKESWFSRFLNNIFGNF